LAALDGRTPQGPPTDIFDAELEQRVTAFQRSRFLVPDGRVGSETLAHLMLAARGPETPSLSSATP
jgi:peptidoglycan hydrolase-like protein with peptidoglycan-binding domain